MEMIDWLMGSGIIWLLLPVYFPYGLSHSRTLQSYCLLSDKTLTLIDLTIFPLNLHWVKPPSPPLNHSPARRPADELVVLPTGKHQKSSSCVTSIGATKRRPPKWWWRWWWWVALVCPRLMERVVKGTTHTSQNGPALLLFAHVQCVIFGRLTSYSPVTFI